MWNTGGAVLLCTSLACAAGVAEGGPVPEMPHLIVRVHTEADLHVAWLASALARAEGIFGDAGVLMDWIDCPSSAVDPVCGRAPSANEFVVRIRRRRVDPESHGCGVSLRPTLATGHYITVFLDCIRDGADVFMLAEPVIAGYTVAHEIGHLLLPTSGHATSGIMRARPDRFDWQRAARGALRFRPAERQQIQDALRRRSAPAQ